MSDHSDASEASELSEHTEPTDSVTEGGGRSSQSGHMAEFEEEEYVDVRKLPLRPPQPALKPEKPVRRPWHPVMWDSSIIGVPPPEPTVKEEVMQPGQEYPHKQRIRNLKRLIAAGKVKPTSETLIFFLCNKFAVSEERQGKISV